MWFGAWSGRSRLGSGGEDLFDQRPRPAGGIENLRQVRVQSAARLRIVEGKAGVTEDRGQNIIEIMNDAPGFCRQWRPAFGVCRIRSRRVRGENAIGAAVVARRAHVLTGDPRRASTRRRLRIVHPIVLTLRTYHSFVDPLRPLPRRAIGPLESHLFAQPCHRPYPGSG